MKISLEIPDEFVKHYKNDKFIDSLKRIEYDILPCLTEYEKGDGNKIYLSGLYEVELIRMLIESFNKSVLYKIYDYEVDDIGTARALMRAGITPHDLREHIHDYEYIINIVRKEFDKEINRTLKHAISLKDNC